MLKSREGKQPPANYYAAILGYLIRAYPNAELTPSLLAQLKPAWDQMWHQGRPADVVAKTTCSCDGKEITLSPAFPLHLPRGAVRAPAGAPRGSLVMPWTLREGAGLVRARAQVKRTERMFEKAAASRSGTADALLAQLDTLRQDQARREREVEEITARLAEIKKGLTEVESPAAERPQRQPRPAKQPAPKPAAPKKKEKTAVAPTSEGGAKKPPRAPAAKPAESAKKPTAPKEKKQAAKAGAVQPSPEEAAMLHAIQGLLPGLANDIAAKIRG